MKKHYNIILANAPIKNGNRGCVALSITVMSIIDKILTDANISYTYYLPNSLYGDDKEHYYKIGNKTIRFFDIGYPIIFPPISIRNIKVWLKHTINRKKYKTVFKSADFISDIGEGDSFSDIYGVPRFNVIDRIHKIARKFEKPYCILPQTIGPFKDEKIAKEAHQSIENASICMARDKQSYDYVINNVPKQVNIGEYIDVAFFLPYERINQDQSYTHVGLNVSALLWNGGYTKNNQFGLNVDYPQLIRSIIDYFLSISNIKIHLIPHVVCSERTLENDYAVSYDLWREYGNQRLVMAPFALSPIEIKSYIAGMDFFMGARMHSTIAAFSAGVAVVPMAYSRKFNGLFEDTLGFHHMVDMKVLQEKEILEKIKKSYQNRDSLTKEISIQNATKVKDCGETLILDLKRFFKLI